MPAAGQGIGGGEDICLRAAEAADDVVDEEEFHFRLFSLLD